MFCLFGLCFGYINVHWEFIFSWHVDFWVLGFILAFKVLDCHQSSMTKRFFFFWDFLSIVKGFMLKIRSLALAIVFAFWNFRVFVGFVVVALLGKFGLVFPQINKCYYSYE